MGLFYAFLIGFGGMLAVAQSVKLVGLLASRRLHHQEFVFADRICADPRREKLSLELLRAWLNPQQLADLENHGWFDVVGGTSGNRYRIFARYASYNVVGCSRGENTIPKTCLCFEPEGATSLGDKLLAQKIALEANEVRVWTIANRIKAAFIPDGFMRDAMNGMMLGSRPAETDRLTVRQ